MNTLLVHTTNSLLKFVSPCVKNIKRNVLNNNLLTKYKSYDKKEISDFPSQTIFKNKKLAKIYDQDLKNDEKLNDYPKCYYIEEFFGSQKTKLRVTEVVNGYYINPTEMHAAIQFEELFQFGACNLGFSKTRTIFIPK